MNDILEIPEYNLIRVVFKGLSDPYWFDTTYMPGIVQYSIKTHKTYYESAYRPYLVDFNKLCLAHNLDVVEFKLRWL